MNKEEVTKIRNKIGVTQEAFARMLGASMVTVNRWENGKSKPSRLYVREMKSLGENHESYLSRH